ncbi:MAG: HAMP domain-containing protein [Bryobacteraceae bacterium]|nr:HAMP domain-containing protein [Bryobacteraceae bacterium]
MPLPKRTANLTARIFLKLIFGVFCVLVVALTAVDFLASKVAERTYLHKLTRELEEKNRMLDLQSVADLGRKGDIRFYAAAKAAGGRITIIAPDGHVIADSEANPAQMDNHSTRPEIAAALKGITGSDIRLSQTIGVKFLYVAIAIPAGALRLAVPLREIDAQVSEIRTQLLASVALAFLPAIIVAAFFARYVSAKLAAIIDYASRLARGEFEARLEGSGRDELGLLVEQLNDTGEKLQEMFEQLQHEHSELEKLERVRKDFVINVSHELRTPLASIQGYTETLLEGALYDPEHNMRFLTIIRQNTERLGRLTADLMTLSRLELKSTRFQFASYYVNDLLSDCVDSMRPMTEKKHISLTLEPTSDFAEMFCDSEAVHQVMSNLLDNALKYTPEHGAITVAVYQIGGDPEMIEVSVRDTGTGIPDEDLPRLFERFYRVDKARSREMGGTGLGLAIVKHLVRAQGGSVRVESQLGRGSRFIFTLPVHDLGLQEYGAVQPELTAAVDEVQTGV